MPSDILSDERIDNIRAYLESGGEYHTTEVCAALLKHAAALARECERLRDYVRSVEDACADIISADMASVAVDAILNDMIRGGRIAIGIDPRPPTLFIEGGGSRVIGEASTATLDEVARVFREFPGGAAFDPKTGRFKALPKPSKPANAPKTQEGEGC